MANWRCEDCYITMDSSEPEETCPKCGKPMQQFQRKMARMFGGGGVADDLEGGTGAGQPTTGH